MTTNNFEFINLDLNDKKMMDKLAPIYMAYEAEISKEPIEDIFPPDTPDENYNEAVEYFSRGLDTQIALQNGEIAGFVCFHIVTDDMPGYIKNTNGWGHLSEIYVTPKHRKSGLGKLLADIAEKHLQPLNIPGIILTDIADNGTFWQKMGYHYTGEIEPNEGGKIYKKLFS